LLVAPLGRPAVLVKQTEHTLLGLVAPAGQILQSLAAGSLLAPADNTAVLVLNEVRLVKAAGGLLCGTVKHLGLGADIHGMLGHTYTLCCDFYLPGKKVEGGQH
jgi:hypothetical protein